MTIRNKPSTPEYREGWDGIWGDSQDCPVCKGLLEVPNDDGLDWIKCETCQGTGKIGGK